MVVLGQACCIREKEVVFVKSGGIREKVVAFGQNWLFSGKSGCSRAKWLYLVKVFVIGQNVVLWQGV